MGLGKGNDEDGWKSVLVVALFYFSVALALDRNSRKKVLFL